MFDWYQPDRRSGRSAAVDTANQTRSRRPRAWCVFAVASAFVLASCGSDWAQVQADWARVQGVHAHERSDITIYVDYGICWGRNDPMPKAKIVESDADVRITSVLPASGGVSLACLTLETVTLAKPIGDRVVIDARTGKRFNVAFNG